MEKADTLRPGDEVEVSIFGPENNCLYKSTQKGFHTIEEAIKTATYASSLSVNPEDCVFEVTNKDTGVSHKYRLNAHGHIKLILLLHYNKNGRGEIYISTSLFISFQGYLSLICD